MTEKEALTKWCPFARERAKQGMPDGGGNRTPYGCADDGPVEDDYVREQAMMFPCIGSACMAFRSTPARRGRMSAIEEEIEMTAQSWCGLAGKP